MDALLATAIINVLPTYLFLAAVFHSLSASTPYEVRFYFVLSAVLLAPAAVGEVLIFITRSNGIGMALLMFVFFFIGLIGLFFFVLAHEKVSSWRRDGVAFVIAMIFFALVYSSGDLI